MVSSPLAIRVDGRGMDGRGVASSPKAGGRASPAGKAANDEVETTEATEAPPGEEL